MKLLRLKLGVDFRSLRAGFEVRFLDDWNWDRSFRFDDDYKRCYAFHPYCLAGRNGSGKSNVLEVLAAIFFHIECMYLDRRPDGFEFDSISNPSGFQAKMATPDAFELEYLIPNTRLVPREPWPKQDDWPIFHIRIVKQVAQRPVLHWVNKLRSGEVTETELTRAEVKAYLPTYVLGYSSGHNEILSLPFLKMRFIHFDEYRDLITKDLPYKGRPEGRMIYLDEQFSQVILLCHFLFPNEAVTTVFKEKVGLCGIRNFRIVIRRHHRLRLAPERIHSMSASDQLSEEKIQVELTSKLDGSFNNENTEARLGLIGKLIKCSTSHYEDFSGYEDGNSHDLYLDFWINQATREAFSYYFRDESGGTEEQRHAATALNLFHSLQTLLTLNLCRVSDPTKARMYRSDSLFLNETIPVPASRERIMRFADFKIMKNGLTETLYSKALSDGEHQLIHTIGLCLLFRYEPALFLLDEPETHLNPDWRASYVSTLRAALEADAATTGVMRDVLLTSHSPFIISDCQKENVLVFEKELGIVTCDRPPDDLQTFGASATLITDEIFGRRETIGDFANEELKRIEAKKGQPGQDARQLARELDRTLGDSIEKTLAITRILQSSQKP